MKGKNDGDKAIADNPYMLELAEFMELPTQRKFEVLLTMIANINQTLEAMAEDLHKLKPEAGFVYAYTPNIPIRQYAIRHAPYACQCLKCREKVKGWCKHYLEICDEGNNCETCQSPMMDCTDYAPSSNT